MSNAPVVEPGADDTQDDYSINVLCYQIISRVHYTIDDREPKTTTNLNVLQARLSVTH